MVNFSGWGGKLTSQNPGSYITFSLTRLGDPGISCGYETNTIRVEEGGASGIENTPQPNRNGPHEVGSGDGYHGFDAAGCSGSAFILHRVQRGATFSQEGHTREPEPGGRNDGR